MTNNQESEGVEALAQWLDGLGVHSYVGFTLDTGDKFREVATLLRSLSRPTAPKPTDEGGVERLRGALTSFSIYEEEGGDGVLHVRCNGVNATALPGRQMQAVLRQIEANQRSALSRSLGVGVGSELVGLSAEASAPSRVSESDRDTSSGVECNGLDTPERVCFYEQDFYVLSNFSSFEVLWSDAYSFKTAEHCYHWLRFATGAANGRLGGTTPTDEAKAIADAVRRAPSAHEAFKIAQANKHLQRADWNDVKVEKMRMVIRAKALQHEYVLRKLLATGDRELVENSWRDDFWGWGPNRDGQNMLGKLWMEVRSELRGDGSRHPSSDGEGSLLPTEPNLPPPDPEASRDTTGGA